MELTTFWLALFALLTFASQSSAAKHRPRWSTPPFRGGHWVDNWSTMPQLVEPGNMPPAPFSASDVTFKDATLRQTVQLSLPAAHHRLRFSNAFGGSDLTITAVTIALPPNNTAGSSEILQRTVKTITFNGGEAGIVIAKGAVAVSDPISFDVKAAQTVVSISTYFASGQAGTAITGHPGSRTTSHLAFTDLTSSPNLALGPQAAPTVHWYYLTTIEAYLPSSTRSLSILGDSITDGRGSTTDKNNRWPDQLLSRLQSLKTRGAPRSLLTRLTISNQAAGGNRLLNDGLGPNVLSRLERDSLAHSAIGYVVVFSGINDIGTAASTTPAQDAAYNSMIAAYKQLITRTHAVNLPVFLSTLTPMCAPASFGSNQPYSTPEREVTRQRVNKWIRENEGAWFEGVVDFDKLVRSSANSSLLDDRWNSGDYLHLSPEGYGRLAEGFPVELLGEWEDGVGSGDWV